VTLRIEQYKSGGVLVAKTVNEYKSVYDNQSVSVSEQHTCSEITVIMKGRFAL